MAMLKNNKKKSIDEYKPSETVPSKRFQPFSNESEKLTYHGYNRRKDAVLRMDRETQQKIKAMARMSTRQLGSNMKDVIGSLVNVALSGFDENHLVWYEELLQQVQEEDAASDRRKAEKQANKKKLEEQSENKSE